MSFKPSSASTSSLLQCLSRPGPSRLAARTRPCPSCLRSASTSTDSEPISPGSPEAEDALLSATPSSSSQSAKTLADGLSQGFGGLSNRGNDRGNKIKPDAPGYENWLKSVGTLYREPPSNGPNWLGKDIPYPTNPSFQPPPPLSDAMRDLVYSEVYTGGTSSSALLSTLENLSSEEKSSTSEHDLKVRINRVSEEFGLSKKRVEAVLKLKEHERGMKERGEILQTPFLEAMEKYLAVRPIRPKNMAAVTRSWAYESQERNNRKAHPSSQLELSEEAAHEAFTAGTKPGEDSSAFTIRDTIESEHGVERAVWEFRDKDVSAEKSIPGGAEALDVPYNRVHSEAELAKTTASRTKSRKDTRPAPQIGQDRIKSKLVDRLEVPKAKSKPATFRFVNSSGSTAEGAMSRTGAGKMQEDHGLRKKKVARQERIRKAIEARGARLKGSK